MKKLITVLMLTLGLLTFTAVHSQENNDAITQTERIIDKYGGQIKQEFNNLMESVTPIATEGFEMVVKLQIAKGVGMLTPIVICCILFILFIIELNKDKNEDFIIVLGIGAGIFVIAAIFSTYNGILHLMAPEWFAIKDILELIKQ